MAQWFNQNSFLLTVAILEAAASWYFLRQGVHASSLFRLFVVTAIIAAVFFGMRPGGSTAEETEDILSRIGRGTPAFLEFKSPN